MLKEGSLCTLIDAEKHYEKGVAALGPVSLSVYPGRILGLNGRNGAGKSTLLKLMAGALRPDSGKCLRSPTLEGRLGYVPQEVALYNDLSGWDNLRFWADVYGLPRKAGITRSRWLLEQMELTEKAKAPVSAYSGGMKRRLHLATALMCSPLLLLLDEPTVGADPHSVQLILSTLVHLRDQGCAVVLVSHQHAELKQVSDQILTLEAGRFVEEE